ncbi:hypothetical protein D3C71_1441320 [compost metagenome]
MARVGGERGEQHTPDLRLLLQPLGRRQRGLLMPFEPHRQGAQAAQREPAHIGRRVGAAAVAKAPGAGQVCVRTRDEPQHEVGMPVDVFGGRMDGDVHAQGVGIQEHRRAPGGIHRHRDVALACRRAHGAHVQHLHGQRRGGLDVDQAGVVPQVGRDVGAFRKVLDGGALRHQFLVAEDARGPVHTLVQQQVAPQARMGTEHGHDGRQSAGCGQAGFCARQRGHAALQLKRGGGARAAVAR